MKSRIISRHIWNNAWMQGLGTQCKKCGVQGTPGGRAYDNKIVNGNVLSVSMPNVCPISDKEYKLRELLK